MSSDRLAKAANALICIPSHEWDGNEWNYNCRSASANGRENRPMNGTAMNEITIAVRLQPAAEKIVP